MLKHLRGIAMSAALLCLPLVLAGVASGQQPRQVYSESFSTEVPGVTAGRGFTAEWVNPENPGAKPHGISHILVVLHPGARFDTTAVTRCSASDPVLMAVGEGACPSASRVGTDEFLIDTGFPEPGRRTTLDSVAFNGDEELIFLAQEALSGVRVVVRARVSGNTLDIPIPFIPGTPPDGAAPLHESADFPALTGPSGKGFFTTPPVCRTRNGGGTGSPTPTGMVSSRPRAARPPAFAASGRGGSAAVARRRRSPAAPTAT